MLFNPKADIRLLQTPPPECHAAVLLVTATIKRPPGWKPVDLIATGMESMPEKNRHMFFKQSSMNPSILPVPSPARP
ncbi:MAG: hypothetical protein Q8O57_10260 [Kiritimatiellota bacterium]|nr:hypothetical protein [Kiritimatiellota bacterium]